MGTQTLSCLICAVPANRYVQIKTYSPALMLLYACTIFTSAFLLFLVQPVIAKQILPWFGGSAAVWTTCLVFFQVALLAGYAYSDFTTRKLKTREQVLLHIALLAASLAVLPIVADTSWKPAGDEDPGLRILGLLLATIGLPYFLLATTGPLVQAWFARTFPQGTVYRLFALSNLASMLALISYPFAFETWVVTATQAYAWTAGYVLFVVLCAASALYSQRNAGAPKTAGTAASTAENDAPAPSRFDLVLWLALAAMGSWLLLAITNHITQNIASIPFLWLAPLTLYLLTFILCFESDGWYRRSLLLGPFALILGFCAWGLQTSDVTLDIKIAIPLYLAGLFICCMFFHGELAKIRPAPRYLTLFYLMVSLGGALGGMFVGLVAPRIFPAYFELGLGFVLTAILAAVTLRKSPIFVWIIAIAMAGICGYFWTQQIDQLKEDTRVMVRNFYGTLRTKDTGLATSEDAVRRLIHGVILHGEQYLKPERRTEPTTYYGPDSGVALAIKNVNPENQRVGVIGLGTGTLAAWGKPGDTYRFYDINPQVIEIAQNEFTYLKDSKAKIEISLGDARLNLEREAPQNFDVLAVDAFSSDAIPVHLITAEAMAVYLKHVKPGGVVVFHVTNRFLKLAPVVKQIADSHGLYAALIVDEAEETSYSKTDWVIVTRDKRLIESDAIAKKASEFAEIPGLRLWTDDFNNLFQILK
jgi:SAM-dependent methyltransferase